MNYSTVLNRLFERRIVPVVGAYAPEDAVAVARALQAAGLDLMEITFRHPDAARSVAAIRQALPEMLVGAGTLLAEDQLDAAREAGAQFGVTPGFNPPVVRAALQRDMPFIPGVATPGELEQALALGLRAVKLFPAGQLGGPAYIKALSGPYLHTGIKLIPLGGVNAETCREYLALPIVGAAGGSWMVNTQLIAAKDWTKITDLTRAALEDRPG